MTRSVRYFTGVTVLTLFTPLVAQASCGTAFCPLHTQWDIQGAASAMGAGTRLGLRFEFIDQDQPRHGKDEVGVGEVPAHHDEIRTINRNWVFSLDHAFNPSWGVSMTLPYVDRFHEHIHHHGGAQLNEAWNFAEIGDARVTGWFQPERSNAGILFGAKLPTGDTDIINADGQEAERTLQPGTGTTDALLGAFYQQQIPDSSASWFVQALWQEPLNDHDNFEPGSQFTLDAGYQHGISQNVALMAQLNTVMRGKDRGSEAETDDSGGDFLFFSPGVSYAVNRSIQIYGFVQLPLYQYVNGVQLTADSAFVVGIYGQI